MSLAHELFATLNSLHNSPPSFFLGTEALGHDKVAELKQIGKIFLQASVPDFIVKLNTCLKKKAHTWIPAIYSLHKLIS